MDMIDRPRHEKCYNFDRSEEPLIELIRISEGKNDALPVRNDVVVFFLKGGLRFVFSDSQDHEGRRGEMLFFPAGGRYYYQTLGETVILMFQIVKPIQICENLSIEKMYKQYLTGPDDLSRQHESYYSVLKINERIWYYLQGVANCLQDGIKCRGYAKLVIKEYILMLGVYYTQKEICEFLHYHQVNEDVAFVQHVQRQWHLFKDVEGIAESMWMTPRKFSAKFKEVFKQTPYNWMKEKRAKLIEKELMMTDKQIKLIAFEQGFSNKSQFSKFCTKELGASPTEIRMKKLNLEGIVADENTTNAKR